MQCIACGRETIATAAKAGVEAAFCYYHYPMKQQRVAITITVRCR